MDTEQWKDIPGYEGVYQASNTGQVRRIGSKKPFLRQTTHWKGYKVIQINAHGVVRTGRVHRLVAMAFLGTPSGRMQVNHKNGIKSDNRVENLEWVTPSENAKHAIATGLGKPPSRSNKVNTTIASQIRQEYHAGTVSQMQLAKKYSLHYDTVRKIVK